MSSDFHEDLVSGAKRVVRADFYSQVFKEYGPEKNLDFFILPGMRPEGEISAIRLFWPDAHILAFDRNEEPVRRALKAGANEGIVGTLDNINSWGAKECLRTRWFNVGNLDICSTILRTEYMNRKLMWAPQGIHSLASASKRIAGIAAVFFSYGRDPVEGFINAGRRWRDFMEIAKGRGELHPWANELLLLPDNLLGRIETTIDAVGHGSYLKRVYFYKGNRMPMMGVVFGQSNVYDEQWSPLVMRVKNTDLRPAVLKVADESGSGYASKLYDVPVSTITAWKAVRTREAVSVGR